MSDQTATARAETFDMKVCERVRRCFAETLAAHPEVRRLACSIDWSGDLNDAKIMHGVWLGASGIVAAPDAVYGSITQTLRMLDIQCSRALELNQHLREQCSVLATEVINRNGEIERLDKEIATRRKTLQEVQGKEANCLRPNP